MCRVESTVDSDALAADSESHGSHGSPSHSGHVYGHDLVASQTCASPGCFVSYLLRLPCVRASASGTSDSAGPNAVLQPHPQDPMRSCSPIRRTQCGPAAPSGDSRRADEHPVLAVGLLQLLWYHRPTRNAHLTRMFYMPNQEGCIQANVPPRGVGFLQTQCVQQCPVL
jgi:hypothetical protein